MVTVTLSGPSEDDATTVFGVLRTAFPTDGATDAVAEDQQGDRPLVWTAHFEPTRERTQVEPASLGAPVTATVQGGYVEVDQLCAALGAAFEVQEEGAASGDQEKEVGLRLRAKK
ncbi:hypothetical protein ABZ454_10940 [Streptomyces sp. NPDC005803]|uniref:hypothetical protein n=1 Tax=Streptomyces sp. NPDC005803 TaxID=3154297 RepID=UPI0033D65AFD